MEENNYTAYQQPLTPEEAPPVKPKKKGKKALFIVIAVVVVLALAAAILLPMLNASPLSVLYKGAVNTTAVLDETELYQLIQRTADGCSLEAALDLAPITQSLIGFPLDGRAVAKFYFSKEAYGLTAAAELGGTPLLDATAMLTPKELTIASPSLLGDQVYGINLELLRERFDSSIFGPEGEYSLGITSKEAQLVVDLLDSLWQQPQIKEDLESIQTDFFVRIFESLQTHATVETADSTLFFGGKDHATTAIVVSMDAPALANFLGEFLTYLRNDQKVLDLLNDTYGTYAEKISAALDDADITSQEIIDSFYTTLDEAIDQLDDLREADLNLSLTFHVTQKGDYFTGTECSITYDGETTRSKFIIGIEDGAITELGSSFDFMGDEDSFTYRITANDDSEYASQFTLTVWGEPVLEASFHWDKVTGGLTVDWDAGEYDHYIAACTLTHNDDGFTALTIHSVEDLYLEQTNQVGLTLTLIPGEMMASLGEYTDLLTMSSAEFDALGMDLYSTIMQLVGILA